MTPRDLMIVALRIMGLWFVIQAALGVGTYSYFRLVQRSLGYSGPRGDSLWLFVHGIVPQVAGVIVWLLVLICAPSIARVFYPDRERRGAQPGDGIPLVDLYRVASFLLGIWVLVQAIQPGVSGVTSIMAEGIVTGGRGNVANLVVATLYVTFGVLLTVGSRGIAWLLALLPYDPRAVASDKFRLRFLLAVTTGLAILLAIVHALRGK